LDKLQKEITENTDKLENIAYFNDWRMTSDILLKNNANNELEEWGKMTLCSLPWEKIIGYLKEQMQKIGAKIIEDI